MSFRSLPVDSMQDKYAPFTKAKKGEDNEEEEDEEGNEGEEFEDMWAFERTSRVRLSIPIMKKLLGQFFELPMKVTVNAPGEGMRQFAWLRVESSTQVAMHVQEPLLSKLKGYRSKFRKWSQSDEMSSDGTPCLTLELGVLEGTSSQYRGVTRNGNNMAAKISSNGPICLGTYSTEEEAARIVDSASHYLGRARANLNFPDEQPEPLSDYLKAKINGLSSSAKQSQKRARNEEDHKDEAPVFPPPSQSPAGSTNPPLTILIAPPSMPPSAPPYQAYASHHPHSLPPVLTGMTALDLVKCYSGYKIAERLLEAEDRAMNAEMRERELTKKIIEMSNQLK